MSIFTAIIVSCLASFRQLFVVSGRSDLVRQEENTPLWRRALLFASKSSKTGSSSSRGESSFTRIKTPSRGENSVPDSTKHLIPLETVYIRHDSDKSVNMGPS